MRWFWSTPTAKRIPSWLNLILWLIAAVLLIRIFAIDSITIQSAANKPQLQPGDNILISKIHYGSRIPFTNHRLSGFSKISRGDLLAFHFPEGDSVLSGAGQISYYALKRKNQSEKNTLFNPVVKYRSIGCRDPEVNRCIGLPGDTISIRPVAPGLPPTAICLPSAANNQLPDAYCQLLSGSSFDYLAEVSNRQLPQELLARLDINPTEVQILPGLGYLLPLRADQVGLVKQRPEVNSLSAYIMEEDKGDYNIFPHDARYPWNRDNFGPVIVPRKGDSIRLTLLNLCIYQRIIEVYEHNRLEVRQDSIIINGAYAETYTFKQDYFFVLGDSRHHSRDSRHWGFLPDDHLIGKPILIWFSANRAEGESMRIFWNRIFKTL